MVRTLTVAASFAFLLALALPVAAQQPPKLEPLPEPPPPPPGADSEQPGEEGVQIQPNGNEQTEETVVNGQRVVRVTRPGGNVYYIIEDRGDGPGARNESLDIGLRVPAWVIRQF
jgi:Protein of unknown function (DUF2782)